MNKQKTNANIPNRFTMSETEKRAFYEKLIKEVQVYEERQPNGQWLKSIEFKLPKYIKNL